MENLVSIRRARPEDPLFNTDYTSMTTLCVSWFKYCASDLLTNHMEVVQDLQTLWNISDLLLDDTYSSLWTSQDSSKWVFLIFTICNMQSIHTRVAIRFCLEKDSFNGERNGNCKLHVALTFLEWKYLTTDFWHMLCLQTFMIVSKQLQKKLKQFSAEIHLLEL